MENILTKAPRIGMGCWAIGGPFWSGEKCVGYSGTNDQHSLAAIEAAWDAGVRVFDTAAVYGAGHSETLLGQTLAHRDDAIILSKLGHSFNAASKQMTGDRYDPDYVRDSVAHSRARLKRDHIHLMQIHLNDLSVEKARPLFDTLEKLRDEGQIGAYGWSTDFPDRVDAIAAADYPGFTAVQCAMNVLIDAPAMGKCVASHNLTQLIRSPLGMGLLTGKFSDGQRVGENDVRQENDNWQHYFFNGQANEDRLKQLETVRDLLTTGGRTLAQGALCWLLAKSPRTLPIPGAKNAKQAEENAAAMAFGPLDAATMAKIEKTIQRLPEDKNPRAA
ncbi:MAG: aldo/keto reductase [Rhizobiaceae bacterium]